MPKIKTVILVDDHRVMMDGLELILAKNGVQVIDKIVNSQEGVKQSLDQQPDLVLMDIDIEPISGIEATRRITERSDIPVLVLTVYDTPMHMKQAFNAGAVGYIPKHKAADELIQAIQRIGEGGTWFSLEVSKKLKMADKCEFDDIQLEILRLMERGLSTKEIAEQLIVTEKKVYYHKDRIKEISRELRPAAQIRFARDLGLL